MRKRKESSIPLNQKTTVSVPEGCELYSLGRTSLLKLAKEAGADIKIGSRRLINVKKMDAYINSLGVDA